MAIIKREDVLGYLESANMLEISALIKDIEEKFDVTAAAPMAVAGGGPAAAAAPAAPPPMQSHDHGPSQPSTPRPRRLPGKPRRFQE